MSSKQLKFTVYKFWRFSIGTGIIMNPENFTKLNSGFAGQENRRNRPDMFKEFDATELYCPKCKRAVPVRKRLLLVLPEGDKYEYLCSICLEPVGSKLDKQKQATTLII